MFFDPNRTHESRCCDTTGARTTIFDNSNARIGLFGPSHEQGEALGTLGLRQASLGQQQQQLGQQEAGFLFDIGQKQQSQQQAELEAARSTALQAAYEPYQRLGFLSDIYKGAPSTQMSVAGASSPSVSTGEKILGLGIAGLSAAAGAKTANLF